MESESKNDLKRIEATGALNRQVGRLLSYYRTLRGMTQKELSERSGVYQADISKFERGLGNPSLSTVERLLYSLEAESALAVWEEAAYGAGNTVREKPEGTYTIADYLALPEERRVELIDGVFYDMGTPTVPHQDIAGQLYIRLCEHIQKHHGKCRAFISPIDVRLDGAEDDYTVVQPDVFVLCRPRDQDPHFIIGAPDFVVEILSPSTRKKDMGIKLRKYQNAGVRELWFVDPDQRKVIVHRFGDDPDTAVYGFTSRVPVGIWNGECEIDFAELSEYVFGE